MPVPMESISLFVSNYGDMSGINGRSSEILVKAKQETDTEGMVIWSRLANLLGEETMRLFMKDLSINTKHQEILSKAYRKSMQENRQKSMQTGMQTIKI